MLGNFVYIDGSTFEAEVIELKSDDNESDKLILDIF